MKFPTHECNSLAGRDGLAVSSSTHSRHRAWWDAAVAAAMLHLRAWHLLLTLWMCKTRPVEPSGRLQVLAWEHMGAGATCPARCSRMRGSADGLAAGELAAAARCSGPVELWSKSEMWNLDWEGFAYPQRG